MKLRFWKRPDPALLRISPDAYDEIAAQLGISAGGLPIDMTGVALVRGPEVAPVADDPIARHNARVLSAKPTHAPPRPLPPRPAPIARDTAQDMVRANG